MRTEDSFFDEHVDGILDSLYSRIEQIEDSAILSPEDEMELAALDRLILLLEAG